VSINSGPLLAGVLLLLGIASSKFSARRSIVGSTDAAAVFAVLTSSAGALRPEIATAAASAASL